MAQNALELKIDDQFGLTLIPQEIRGSLGFVTGSTLALTEEKGSISSHTLAELYSSLYSIKGEMVYEVLHIREAQKMKARHINPYTVWI